MIERFAPWLLPLLGVVIFYAGWRSATEHCEAQQLAPLRKQLSENIEQMGRYEQQLSAARHQHSLDQAAIDGAAARPVPRLVCHRTGATVPPLPATAGDTANRPGLDRDLPGSDFEPGPRLRVLAVAAARALEACYAELDTWPNQGMAAVPASGR